MIKGLHPGSKYGFFLNLRKSLHLRIFIIFRAYSLLRPLLIKAYAGLTKGPVRIPAFHKSQLHVGKSPNHRLKHRRQRDILPGIVHYPKKIQKRLNLNRRKIPCPGFRMGRDSRLGQHPCIYIPPSRKTAEQNHNIPIRSRPEYLLPSIPHLLISQKLPDPLRRGIGFHLPRRKLRLPVGKLRCVPVKKQKLRPVHLLTRLRHGGSRIKRRRFIVADSSHPGRHKAVKYFIYSMKHLLPASEVPVKINPHSLPLLCLGIGVIFLHKKLRPGQTEPVDALLHIPHHKYIGTARLPPAHTV